MQPLTFCLIQTATRWHDAAANRVHFDGLFNSVPAKADVLVLPEMFNSGFTMAADEVAETMTGSTVQWMQEAARSLQKVVCGSMAIRDNESVFNRFLWVMPDGGMTHYDKRHCFRMADEHLHYASGDERIVIEYRGWRICPIVCYDLRFPVWCRNRNDYDTLLCVANWPLARRAAWNTLLRARAIENQCYSVAVNIVGTDGNGVEYGGGSAAYAPDGAVMLERFDDAVLATVTLDAAPLERLREDFPVWQDADRFRLL